MMTKNQFSVLTTMEACSEPLTQREIAYTTKPYTYSELCGSRVKRPVKDAILSWIPTSPSDILPKVSKLLGVLLGIGALIAAVVILITKYL